MSISEKAKFRLKLLATLALVAAAAIYGYFAVSYQNANWIFSPPNALHFEGRTYKPSNFDLMDSPPPRDQYTYTEVTRMHPLGKSIYGVEGMPGQMNLYLQWDGKYKAYAIQGGPP
ncbi:hypothetical protein ACFVX3_31310 [Rhodococcus erythropolis]